jgi:hypothetical protein
MTSLKSLKALAIDFSLSGKPIILMKVHVIV